MRSLIGSLLIGLLLSLAVVFAVQWSAVHVAIDAMMKDYIAGELNQDVDELRSALSVQPGGEAALAIAHFDPSFLSPSSGHYYQIMAGREIALRSASLAGDTLLVRPAHPGERYVDNIRGPKG